MVLTDPDLLINAHAITKMHLESRNFWNTGVKQFYEFLHVLPSQIYLRANV